LSAPSDLSQSVTEGQDALIRQTGLPKNGSTTSLARLYMTSDLRAATGLSRTHLDFYLREGLVVPTARTESGYLLFDEQEVDLLRQIIAERQAGVPLREIRQRLGR
jgi:MerR family transcriptional regulator, thiopeptide resistance regulator